MAPYHTICGSLELLNGEKAHVLAGWWVFIALSDQVVVPVKSTKKTWPLDLPTHNWIISHYPQDTMVTIVLLCQDTMTIRCVSCSQGCSDECVVQVSTNPNVDCCFFYVRRYTETTHDWCFYIANISDDGGGESVRFQATWLALIHWL